MSRVITSAVVALTAGLLFAPFAAQASAATTSAEDGVEVVTMDVDSSGELVETSRQLLSAADALKMSADRAAALLDTTPAAAPEERMAREEQPGTTDGGIRRIWGCREPNDFLDLHFGNGALACFAYAGGMGVRIQNVYQVDSGNNTGWVDVYAGGHPRRLGLYHKFESHDLRYIFGRTVTASYVHIN